MEHPNGKQTTIVQFHNIKKKEGGRGNGTAINPSPRSEQKLKVIHEILHYKC